MEAARGAEVVADIDPCGWGMASPPEVYILHLHP